MNNTLRKALAHRKRNFRKALALAELTAKEWCEREHLTEGHLYQVFRGDRSSPPLLAKIDAFVAKHLEPSSALAS